MGGAASKPTLAGGGRCVNYLVTSYSDVKDIVMTIEKLIARTPVTDKSELRQACELSITPLPNRSGYLFRIKLPDDLLRTL